MIALYTVRFAAALFLCLFAGLGSAALLRPGDPAPSLSYSRHEDTTIVRLRDATRGADVSLYLAGGLAYAAWTRDSRALAILTPLTDPAALYIHRPASGDTTLLFSQANPDLTLLSWSPDGRWLLLYDSFRHDLLYVDPSAAPPAAPRFVSAGQPDALWSPDSARLYYRDAAGTLSSLATTCLDGGAPCFAEPVSVDGAVTGLLGWMPDGERMMVLTEAETGVPDSVATLHPSTGRMSALIENPLAGVAPVWSPDGRVLAASLAVPGSDTPERASEPIPGLYLVEPDTGTRELVWAGIAGQIAWNPDGNSLAFELVYRVGRERSIWVYDRSSRLALPLTPRGQRETSPAWVTYRGQPAGVLPFAGAIAAALALIWLAGVAVRQGETRAAGDTVPAVD